MADEAIFKGKAAFSFDNFTDKITNAVRHFTDAVNLAPTSSVIYPIRSAAYASPSKYVEALSDAKKTVELKPDWSEGYSLLGAAHVNLHNYNDAVEAYNKGLEIDPNNEALKSGLSDAQSAAATRSKPLNLFGDAFGPEMWVNLTSDPSTRGFMQQPDFINMMKDLNLYLKDPRVMQAVGMLLNSKLQAQSPDDMEMPDVPPERKRLAEEQPVKDKEKKRELEPVPEEIEVSGEDVDTAAIELDETDISFLTNQAVTSKQSFRSYSSSSSYLSLADPYGKAHNIVKILLSAPLFCESFSVEMHDVIRELASDIRLTLEPEENCSVVESELLSRAASEGHQFLLGAGAGLTEPPANEKWEQAKMIFLMDNDLRSLPDNLSCPKLLTLCLQRNNRLRAIPKSFFVGMPHLQILNLSRTIINSLPPSVFKLKLLKVLLLCGCKLFSMLPPEIGALEHLELLDLQETEIYNLPNEIGSLTCLQHLLVAFYGTSNSREYAKLPTILISNNIISSLPQLHELSIDVYPGDQRWSRDVKSVIEEVIKLEQLKNLSFYFPEVNLLELFIQESPSWKNEVLTKFKFIVGHNVERIVARVPEDMEFVYNQQVRCLRFVNGKTVPSAVVQVLSFSTAFYLDHHLDIQSLSQFGVRNINELEVCIVSECHEIKAVIDNKGAENSALTTFPVLEFFVIHYLWNLRSIWAGPVPSGSLSRLKFLSVHTCPKLPFVLTSSMLRSLYSLEVLAVENCQAVTEVILEESDVASGYVVLPKLRKLRLHYLPSLVSIWKGTWPSVEHISFYNCPELKSLPFGFELIKSIKGIKAEKMWWEKLIWKDRSLYLQLQAHFTEISYEDL